MKQVQQKPMVRAHLFADRGCGCAMIGADPETADMELEPILFEGSGLSGEWHQAAFLACTIAYRRLQARNADKDVVCTLELPAEWQMGRRSRPG